jgi:hypothetical protein
MRTIIDSDRGPVYTLLCLAVAFGLIVGAGIVPILYLFGWIAGLLLTLLIPYLWLDLAVILALIVYYTGVFIAATVATLIWDPAVHIVDSAFQSITGAMSTATNYVTGFWNSIPSLV